MDYDDLIEFLEETISHGKKIVAGIDGGDRYQAHRGHEVIDTTEGG